MPSRPYVTLLVSVRDQAGKIVRETLDKYGLDKENADDYALVQVSSALLLCFVSIFSFHCEEIFIGSPW